jgi:hypothetical protein
MSPSCTDHLIPCQGVLLCLPLSEATSNGPLTKSLTKVPDSSLFLSSARPPCPHQGEDDFMTPRMMINASHLDVAIATAHPSAHLADIASISKQLRAALGVS